MVVQIGSRSLGQVGLDYSGLVKMVIFIHIYQHSKFFLHPQECGFRRFFFFPFSIIFVIVTVVTASVTFFFVMSIILIILSV